MALHHACFGGHLDAARALLAETRAAKRRGGAQRLLELADFQGWRPLHWAGAQGHAAVVALLLDAGADVDARSQNASTPLHLAAKHGGTAALSALISGGADVGAADDARDTPLHVACRRLNDAAAALLVGAGAPLGGAVLEVCAESRGDDEAELAAFFAAVEARRAGGGGGEGGEGGEDGGANEL